MTITEYIQQSDLMLYNAGERAVAQIVSDPGTYGLDVSAVAELQAIFDEFATNYVAYRNAQLAFHASVPSKNSTRAEFAAVFARLMTQSMSNPAVSDENLAFVDLDRPQPRRPRQVKQPLHLFVDAIGYGSVAVRWDRNENSQATTFVLEKQVEGGPWEYVWSGTRTRTKLRDLNPGQRTVIRVKATKGEKTSPYSNVATVYDPATLRGTKTAA